MTPEFGLFAAGVAVAGGFDLARRRIPNRVTLPLAAAGLAGAAVRGGAAGLGFSLVGLLLGGGLLFAPFVVGWLGGGDVKLMAAIGAWLGPVPTLLALGLGLFFGGVMALGLALRHRNLGRDVYVNLLGAFSTATAPPAVRRARALTVPLGAAFAAAAVISRVLLDA